MFCFIYEQKVKVLGVKKRKKNTKTLCIGADFP